MDSDTFAESRLSLLAAGNKAERELQQSAWKIWSQGSNSLHLDTETRPGQPAGVQTEHPNGNKGGFEFLLRVYTLVGV